MRPYEKLKTIYEIASRMIVRGEGAWKDYLSFAARIHKYSFDNALLVYAQNPDVTTLASIPQWNKVGRNVNRGSKGIAVCEYETAKLTLSYLFDISQTNGREIRFLDWQLDDDMKSEISTRLIRADELSATDFSETVTALASKRVNDNYENCLRSIMANSQDHIFSELPEGGLEAQLVSLLTDSTAYFVGKRCGLADDEIMLEGGMSTISDFNRIPLIATLGNTVTSCAKEILIEMELTIKTINAERTANNERKQSEYQLHGTERNIVPESASIQRADSRSAVGQIRQNGDGVPERKPPQSLYSFENGWHSDGSDAHGSADSHRENRGNDTGNAQKRTDAQHRGHDGTDTALEQPETVSRRNSNKGNRTDTEIKTENVVVAEPPKDGSVVVSEDDAKAKMSDDEIVKHYETILMSTDVYPIEMHRRLYLILKDEPDNSDWQIVSNEVYSIFAEYGNREYQGEVLYRTELVNKDGISMFFGDGSTYLPWIFVANIINAMIVDGDYPGDFTQLFEEARKILEKAEYVVSDEYLMTAVLELQKEKIYNPTALQIAEQTEAVIIRDAEDIEEEDFSAVVTAVEHSDDTEDVFAEPVEVQKKAERKPRAKQDLPSRNYRAFAKLFPDIISGKYSALMLSAGESFDPLEIYHKGGNRYSMEHYWINNGDRMYDPYMEFIIDRENQTIQAASYENSNVGLAQQVFTDEGYYPQLQKELNSFLSNWLKNISFQDYSPVRAIEIINDEEKTVTFPIEPETPQLNLFTDLTDGEQITMTDISSDDKKNVVTEESEIDENAEFKILEECTGSHHGQIDMIMTAYKGEIPVGYMQYSIFEDAPHINNIEVMPSQRRRGIATRLLQNLQGQYPTSEIVWGIMTDDGKALHDAITYSFDSEDYESVKRGLDEVNKGLAEFHQRIDEGESLNDDETAFMNDLSDIQYKLEKQLEELSPTHTFVRLPKAETAVEPIAEKPTQKPQNFRYSEGMELYPTGLKSKYKANIEAIKLLKAIEEDRRQATPDEQIILARYVGWGGLANAFNPKAKDWEKEYQELKLLLTEAEYKAAMDSTITAYYTEPELIKSIYTALDNFGFEGGKNRKLLDPAMGTGNFFSVLPEHLSDTKLYGVEIDSITGRIAKLLYPNVSIENTGYETTKYEDNTFDVIIGNIPFNSIHIYDPRYKDNDFYIHDYFFAKSLDLAKPGGIIAFITSKGTMDKYDDSVRKYIACRAEFIGAIRLPNTTFKAVAGTEVTADIVFLKKREEPIEEWNLADELWFDVTASMQTNWVRYNNYFIQHPEMVLGEMQHSKKMYGREDGTACVAPDDYNFNLNEKLRVAVGNLSAQFTAQPDKERKPTHTVAIDEAPEYENAPPGTKNFTFVVKDDNIYYCEKNKLIPQPLTGKKAERIKGLCSIRTALLDVINLQSGQYDESELKEKQKVLNEVYDTFVKKYGAIGSNANILVFSDDDQFPLLRSIENEIKNPDGTKSFEKAQIFYKATIHPRTIPTSADTAVEALYISLNTRLKVDLRYMSQLTGKQPIAVINELGDRIFLNPQRYSGNILDGWETAEEYLSGHVRDKLVYAEYYAEKEPELFSRNVRALEEAQPVPLGPSDINAPVGAPWIPIEYYRQFMYETFDTPSEYRYESENDSEKECITLNYMEYTTVWRVLNKFYDRDSVKVYQTFGTHRKNAYEIFEDSLNQQITTVKDRVEYIDDEGNRKEKYVVNPKETRVARAKQAQIKEAFAAWLWKDAERKEDLLQIYNSRFNTVVPREYDGSHLIFPGMSEEMKLRPHQMNFAARVIYSGTGLAAHEVGAGKTAALIAAGMYLKNLGAIKKPVYVVPNPIVGQWATEFYRFFPNANILVSTIQDFTAQNRNRYVSRIAMGDYDAVILAHSQFERIPISAKRQIEQLEEQIVQISYAVGRIKAEKGENWTVKQMVTFKHNLEERLERLSALQKKDDLLTFEQLGIDFMFVDEAHMFKNCFVYTKMSRVAGINTSSSQRAFDMLNKCQYLQEINNGRGVVFATGTPISNSMTEMFVMIRYLEPDELKRQGLSDFDSWAATYGEVVSSLEITPEGGGYRMRQRFAKFHNLPELMRTYRLVADVQTAEMLNLPRPEIYGGKKEIISSTPTEHQKKIMATFIERAEAIRNGQVKPYEDNMLKLTNEARQMAIDPRLIDRSAPNDPNSKLNMCIDQIYKVWKETEADRLTQLVFCDVSIPAQKPIIQMEQVDGVYKAIPNQFTNVYDEIKKVLMERGVPESEIIFIHDAKTEVQRQAIFEKTQKGEIRVLLGSTGKLGTGVNVQDRVIALHHLDVPWKPSDITQRDGRGLRQGNMNKAIHIYHYIAEGTFDAYLWQIQEQKLRFITQVTTAKSIARSCEDIDETVLTAAQFKAIATDNPQLLEKMELENRVSELRILQRNHQDEQAMLERKIKYHFPNDIENCKRKIEKLQADLETLKATDGQEFSVILKDKVFTERTKAGEFLLVVSREIADKDFEIMDVGEFRGLKLQLVRDVQKSNGVYLNIKGNLNYDFGLGDSDIGNITRIGNAVDGIPNLLAKENKDLANLERQLETAKGEYGQPFIYEAELAEKSAKLTEIDTELELGKGDEDTVIDDSENGDNENSEFEPVAVSVGEEV